MENWNNNDESEIHLPYNETISFRDEWVHRWILFELQRTVARFTPIEIICDELRIPANQYQIECTSPTRIVYNINIRMKEK